MEVPLPLLRICVADQDVPPFSYARYEGRMQQQVRLAARRLGWVVTFTVRPWLRCQAEITRGKFDALMPVAPGAENLHTFVFPRLDGKPDPALALGAVRVVAARTFGSSADWDGQHFIGVHGPVLYLQGLRSLNEYLALKDVSTADTRTTADMVRMLLAERSNLIVDIESRLHQVLEEEHVLERVEILPETVLTRWVYLPVSQHFYSLHGDFVEKLWRATAGQDELQP